MPGNAFENPVARMTQRGPSVGGLMTSRGARNLTVCRERSDGTPVGGMSLLSEKEKAGDTTTHMPMMPEKSKAESMSKPC